MSLPQSFDDIDVAEPSWSEVTRLSIFFGRQREYLEETQRNIVETCKLYTGLNPESQHCILFVKYPTVGVTLDNTLFLYFAGPYTDEAWKVQPGWEVSTRCGTDSEHITRCLERAGWRFTSTGEAWRCCRMFHKCTRLGVQQPNISVHHDTSWTVRSSSGTGRFSLFKAHCFGWMSSGVITHQPFSYEGFGVIRVPAPKCSYMIVRGHGVQCVITFTNFDKQNCYGIGNQVDLWANVYQSFKAQLQTNYFEYFLIWWRKSLHFYSGFYFLYDPLG